MTEPTNLMLEKIRRDMAFIEAENKFNAGIIVLAIESLSKIAAGNRDGIERMEARECLNEIKKLVDNHQKGIKK